ncbi:hypothetical protein PMAYCL1PPCAC_32186, partial [Pristionchus mayeri]
RTMRLVRSLLSILLLHSSNSLKFLAYSPQFGASHVHFMGRLSDALVDAGHEVVMLSSRMDTLIGSTGTKRARVIEIPQTAEGAQFEHFINNKMVENVWRESSMIKMTQGAEVIMQANIAQCNATLYHPGLINRLQREKFDVGFTESHDLCSIGLFHLAGIDKFAITESLAMVDGHFFYSQVPSNPAYVPSFSSGLAGEQMSFPERAANFFVSFMTSIAKLSMLQQWEAVFTDYENDFPSLRELVERNSLVFLNSDPLVEFPRPSAARIVDIGGITVSNGAEPLNETWSSLLSLRPHTILISFGSFAKAHLMPDEYKHSIIAVAKMFAEVTFIFKYEKPEHRLSEGVDNIVETAWMPQNDILHDDRLTAFVTHGGQGSVTEAYYAGIPLVVIPICFDQLRNAAQVARNGVGLVVEKSELMNEQKLAAAIQAMLTNDRYRAQARKVRQLLHERPFSTRKVFVRNMEFLGKHGPLRQLDHYGRHLNVLQYYLVDVIAVITGAILITLIIIVLLACAFGRFVINKINTKSKQD